MALSQTFLDACEVLKIKDGQMNKKAFQIAFGILDEDFSNNIFQIFDSNDMGYLNIHEFVTGYDHWQASLDNPAEKALLTFNLFDLDGSGALTKSELIEMLRSLRSVSVFDIDPGNIYTSRRAPNTLRVV